MLPKEKLLKTLEAMPGEKFNNLYKVSKEIVLNEKINNSLAAAEKK